MGEYYKKMGKTVYAIFDKQDDDIRKKIEVAVDYPYECFLLGKHTVERVCSGLSPLRRDWLWC